MPHRIRRGDLVQVVSGADRGKQGRVIAVDAARRRVRVEKVRTQKRHLKAGRKGARGGGVIDQEGFIDASNVMLVEPTSHRPSRVRMSRDAETCKRVFTRTGAPVPDPAQG